MSSGQWARTASPRTWATRCSAWATWSPSLARLVPAAVAGSSTARQGWPARRCHAWMNVPRTGSCGPPSSADCEIVINVDSFLVPSVVTRLRSSGARVAFWFPDHVANLGRQLMLLAPYDAIFFKEPFLTDRLRAMLDLPVYYLPQACNPRWHRPVAPAGTEPCLVIAGNMYPSRVRLLDRLIAKGIPLRLYGGGFPRWIGETACRAAHTGRYVAREEKARVFRSAAGVLNTMHLAEVNGVNARLFEAAGCGAAVLTEFRSTVPELFAVGKEVLVFHDFDDLVEQATRLLSERGLTARLGDAAAQRAHRDHTYDLRVTTILEKLS